LEHYLALWREFEAACGLAAVILVGLAVVLNRRSAPPGENSRLALFAAAFLGLTVVAGARHDYTADLEIWAVVLSGGDPWWLPTGRSYPLNAYGPAFLLLSPVVLIHPLLPKLLFALAYVGYVISRPMTKRRWVLLVLNPFPWIETAWFGHFDVLIGLACAKAWRVLERRRFTAGTLLGVGVLLKYLPLVIAPFGLRRGDRLDRRYLGAFAATIVVGLAASWLVWGTSVFRPIEFAATRGANLLSIFRFLEGGFSPLPAGTQAGRWAGPITALAGLLVFAWSRIRSDRVAPRVGACLGLATTLLFYRVGFIQYWMVWLMLLADADGSEAYRLFGRPIPSATATVFLGWLAGFDLLYARLGGVIDPNGPWGALDAIVGLPHFLLGSAWIVAVILDHERRAVDPR
jgi:hypothetical protein